MPPHPGAKYTRYVHCLLWVSDIRIVVVDEQGAARPANTGAEYRAAKQLGDRVWATAFRMRELTDLLGVFPVGLDPEDGNPDLLTIESAHWAINDELKAHRERLHTLAIAASAEDEQGRPVTVVALGPKARLADCGGRLRPIRRWETCVVWERRQA